MLDNLLAALFAASRFSAPSPMSPQWSPFRLQGRSRLQWSRSWGRPRSTEYNSTAPENHHGSSESTQAPTRGDFVVYADWVARKRYGLSLAPRYVLATMNRLGSFMRAIEEKRRNRDVCRKVRWLQYLHSYILMSSINVYHSSFLGRKGDGRKDVTWWREWRFHGVPLGEDM